MMSDFCGEGVCVSKMTSKYRTFRGVGAQGEGIVSPLPMLFIIQALFLQKTKLYRHITNIYLEFGFEFGPQRI
jgi:hypothetical protein